MICFHSSESSPLKTAFSRPLMSSNASGTSKSSSRLLGKIPDECQDGMQSMKSISSHTSGAPGEQKALEGSQAGFSCPSTNRMQTQSSQKGSHPNGQKAGIKQTKPCSREGTHAIDRPGSKTDISLMELKSPTGSCIKEESKNDMAKETQTATESVCDSGKKDEELERSQSQLKEQSTGQKALIIIPEFRIKESMMGNSPHARYYELGHCLRSNLFPGVPITMKSLVQDSYTKEVNQLSKIDMRHWHGRKTDDIGKWHEMHFRELNVKKAFEERQQEKNLK